MNPSNDSETVEAVCVNVLIFIAPQTLDVHTLRRTVTKIHLIGTKSCLIIFNCDCDGGNY